MTPPSKGRAIAALCALGMALTIGNTTAQTDDPLASLPSGPRDLLAEIASDPTSLSELVGGTRTAKAWTAHLAGMSAALTADQVAMLAEYLALNAPAVVEGADAPALIAALPADGRDLFAANCFSCHGVVTYYLLQDRDQAGWMDIFSAPYHRRLLSGDNERETFASYASHAMPIAEEQVPEAWKE